MCTVKIRFVLWAAMETVGFHIAQMTFFIFVFFCFLFVLFCLFVFLFVFFVFFCFFFLKTLLI